MTVLLLIYFLCITYMIYVPCGLHTGKCLISLRESREPQIIENRGSRLECRELASTVRLPWPVQPRTGITGQQNTLPMGEEDTSPLAMEKKGAIIFCLAQHAWEERREGINYKKWWLLGTLRVLEGISWKGKKVWLPMGKSKASQRTFHGTIRVYYLKKIFLKYF